MTGAHLDLPSDRDAYTSRFDSSAQEGTYQQLLTRQLRGIAIDHQQFYQFDTMACLAGGIAAGALMANTGFDEQFVRDSYLDSIVLAPSDELYEVLHEPKFLGDGYYTIPVFAAFALAEPMIGTWPMGSEATAWGQRSLRSILVGGPPLLVLQWATGEHRPTETDESSEWRPFHDNNGVSGHSFMGAIPVSVGRQDGRQHLDQGELVCRFNTPWNITCQRRRPLFFAGVSRLVACLSSRECRGPLVPLQP